MSTVMTVRSLIQAAITLAGSEAKLGEACGVSQSAIWKAKKAGRVSGELAVRIDRATGGAVPKHRLRPDLWEQPAAGGSATAGTLGHGVAA